MKNAIHLDLISKRIAIVPGMSIGAFRLQFTSRPRSIRDHFKQMSATQSGLPRGDVAHSSAEA